MRPPTKSEIRELGEELNFDLTDEEVAEFHELVSSSFGAFETVDEYGDTEAERKAESSRSTESWRPARDENPQNGWITRCEVIGSEDGPLAGLDVGLKDSISLAGVEMTCGSAVLEGYVPDVDATIVTRLLDAGATIIGKTNMDDMALTGAGFSSAYGPTLNPRDSDYLAGGSSGGSAVVVVNGDVDLAIGCDQGGSIRAPASWSGVVGHKPTYGLVPYSGIVGLDNTIDYTGPMARDVETCAKALTVMAGKAPGDPRQPETVPTEDYGAALDGDISDLSIGVLEEGFTRPDSEAGVNEVVRETVDTINDRGADVESCSVPMHDDAWDLNTVTLAEGLLNLIEGEGVGYGWKGWYNTSFVDMFSNARRARGHEFPTSVKQTLLLGKYVTEMYPSYYAKAMNLREELTRRYDESLEEYDLLAMPTTPQTAKEHIPDQSRFQFAERAWKSLTNTSPFNMSGHPAVTVPAETHDGLPVGLMFVGRPFDDATVLNAAHAVETL